MTGGFEREFYVSVCK